MLKVTNWRLPNPTDHAVLRRGYRLCPRFALGGVFGERRQAAGAWLRRSVVALAGFDDLRVERVAYEFWRWG